MANIIKPSTAVIIEDEEGHDSQVEKNIRKLNSKVLFADRNNIIQITFDGTTLKEEKVQNTIL